MQPRRSDSKKWTSLPADYLETVSITVKNQYETHLKNVEVIAEGRVFDKEIVLRVGFLPQGRLKQHNFELSMDLPEAKDQLLIKLNHGLDFLGSVLLEFFEKDGFESSEFEENLPVLWKPLSNKKDIFFFQYSTVNSKLESLADEWLNKQGQGLVNETADINDDDAYNFTEQYDAETLEKIIDMKKLEKEAGIASMSTPNDPDNLH